jgi:hypothetical protein
MTGIPRAACHLATLMMPLTAADQRCGYRVQPGAGISIIPSWSDDVTQLVADIPSHPWSDDVNTKNRPVEILRNNYAMVNGNDGVTLLRERRERLAVKLRAFADMHAPANLRGWWEDPHGTVRVFQAGVLALPSRVVGLDLALLLGLNPNMRV